MAEENNIKWLDLFKKVIKPGCSFGDYIEFMTMVNPDSNNLDVKSRQAVTVLSEKKDVAFQETEKGFVTLPSLLESSEAQKVLLASFEEAEKNLLSSIPELEPGNTYEIGNLKRKFLLGIRNDIRYISHHTAEKVFRRQGELNRKYADERRIQKEFHEYVEREIPRMYDHLMNKAVRGFNNVYFDNLTLSFSMHRKEQKEKLTEALTKLIPETDYYSCFGGRVLRKISPQQGKRQAEELATEIVDLVYDVRREIFKRFKTQPIGGNIGNLSKIFSQGQMECSDWAELFSNHLEFIICNWFMDNANSFSVEWLRCPPYIGDTLNDFLTEYLHIKYLNFGEHNLIRIRNSNWDEVYIDPWHTGGREIITSSKDYNLERYKVIDKGGISGKYPNWNKNKSYFKGLNEMRKSKYPARDRTKGLLDR